METYRICIQGHLDQQWNEWFYGVSIENLPDGHSILTTPSIDQAALHGILNRVRDLNLILISLERIEQQRRLDD